MLDRQVDDILDVLHTRTKSGEIKDWALVANNVVRLVDQKRFIDLVEASPTEYDLTIRTDQNILIANRAYISNGSVPEYQKAKDLYDTVKQDLLPARKELDDLLDSLKKR